MSCTWLFKTAFFLFLNSVKAFKTFELTSHIFTVLKSQYTKGVKRLKVEIKNY